MAGSVTSNMSIVAGRLSRWLEPREPELARQFTGRSPIGLGVLALLWAIALVGLMGGVLQDERLVQLAPGLAPMQFNTALCFALGAAGLLLRRTHRAVTVGLGSLMFVIAFATSLEYLTGAEFGIDTFFVDSQITDRTTHAGRMSAGTATCFMLASLAIILSSVRMSSRIRPLMLEFVALILFASSCQGLMAQSVMRGSEEIWPLFSGMAVQTSLGFICLAVALTDMSWATTRQSGASPVADWLLSTAFAVATLVDLITPVGVIGGIVYLPVIFLAGRAGSIPTTMWTAALATSVALLGFFWSPQQGADLQYSLFNRLGEVVAIWTVALLLCRVIREKQALRQSQQRYTLAVEAAKVGLWDQRLDGTENFWWSPVMYRLLGFNPGELAPSRRALAERLHPDDRWMVKSAYLEHLIRRTPYEVEMRLRHRTLGYRWYLCAGQAVWSKSGKPVRVTGTLLDIDDRKRAAQQRNEAEWVATVSHELRTPMTSCLGALAIAKSDRYGPLPGKVPELLDMAHASGARLVSLIDDLLAIQKLSSGHFEMNLAVASAHELCDAAIDAVSGAAVARGVTISRRYCVGNPRLRVDRERFVQVLVNFLSNAIKYGPEQGGVRVETDWNDTILRLSVVDEGPGIPESDRDRIFDKFFRVAAESHRQVGGAGLGLSICKSIVDGLGGHIGFDSQDGRGSAFWVEFPVVTWSEGEGRPQSPQRRKADGTDFPEVLTTALGEADVR